MSKRPGYFWAWVDLLYGMLAVFTFLFIVAVTQVHPAEKASVDAKAEYIVQLTWPAGSTDDLDLHLLLPDDRQLDFTTREVGWCVLDHDDLGMNGSYTDYKTGKVVRLEHRETITVRAVVPGTYVVNVHVYQRRDDPDVHLPYPAHVVLTRLNPRLEQLAAVDVPLERVGEQRTAFAFTVRPDGSAAVDPTADLPFIPERR